jgi:methionyl-tRNA synthetase
VRRRVKMISLDEFRRLDLRIGEIVSAESMLGSTRLLRVEVDLGAERRVLVAGLAQHYKPEALLGMKVIVLANVKPAIIRGVESQGMLLGADCDTTPALLTVNQPVTNGTSVQ